MNVILIKTDFDIVEVALNNGINDKENVDPNEIEEIPVEEKIAETQMDTVGNIYSSWQCI